MSDQKVIHEALGAFHNLTGFEAQAEEVRGALGLLETRIGIEHEGATHHLSAYVSPRWTEGDRRASLLMRAQVPGVVAVTRHFTRPQAEALRQDGTAYLDGSGNAFLRLPSLFVLVIGQQNRVRKTARAASPFTAGGLRLLALLLDRPDALRWPLRKTAAWAGVAFGPTSDFVRDLAAAGYVETSGTSRAQTRRWRRLPELLARWAPSYNETLKPKLACARFRALRDWRTLDVESVGGYWSGEAGAERMGLGLVARRPVLYTAAPRSELAARIGLVPDGNGAVEVCRRFWTDPAGEIERDGVAPLPLVYADLLASGDARNLEAASALLALWNETRKPL